MPATTTDAVISRDGTEIAFERLGAGPAVILVSSALADRKDTAKLATLLAAHFTVINYDRRGRGASGDNYGRRGRGASGDVDDERGLSGDAVVEREVQDLAAIMDHVGGSASLFGSSSGAVLALRAAAAGLSVDRLALYEPPFAVGADGFAPPEDFGRHIDALLAQGKRGEAVKYFMTQAQGMPAFVVTMMRLMPGVWSGLTKLAHTLPYDIAVMGGTQQGRPLEAAEWAGATAPALVLTGGKSPAGFHDAARALAEVLPGATHRTLPGLDHGAVMMAPKKLAPTLTEFLGPWRA